MHLIVYCFKIILTLLLLVLYEQFMNHFFLWSIISTKSFHLKGSYGLQLKLEYPPGHTALFPLHFYLDQTGKVRGNYQLKNNSAGTYHTALIPKT